MSETGSSFEEIKLEQSTSGESSSASDQEQSDSSHNDQHSTGVRSATKMAGSVEPPKTAQLNDLEFELAWKTRDEIIASLSQHTKLLSGQIIKATDREQVRKANNDLMATLMNLPLKADVRDSESLSPDEPNEVVLDLKWEARLRIVDTLMTNHQVALMEVNCVASECKSKLIDQNNELINELLKLKSRILPISQCKQPAGVNVLPQQQLLQSLKNIEKALLNLNLSFDKPGQLANDPQPNPTTKPPSSTSILQTSNSSTNVSTRNVKAIKSTESNELVSHMLRSWEVQKVVNEILPYGSLDPKAAQEKRMNSLIQYAQNAELNVYKQAKSREEYYELLGKRITKIQKGLEERQSKQTKEEWIDQLINEQNTEMSSANQADQPNLPPRRQASSNKQQASAKNNQQDTQSSKQTQTSNDRSTTLPSRKAIAADFFLDELEDEELDDELDNLMDRTDLDLIWLKARQLLLKEKLGNKLNASDEKVRKLAKDKLLEYSRPIAPKAKESIAKNVSLPPFNPLSAFASPPPFSSHTAFDSSQPFATVEKLYSMMPTEVAKGNSRP